MSIESDNSNLSELDQGSEIDYTTYTRPYATSSTRREPRLLE